MEKIKKYFVDYKKLKVIGKVIECNIWKIEAFHNIIPPDNWKRQMKKDDEGRKVLEQFGITEPKGFIGVAVSGTSIGNSTGAEIETKEIFGMDIFREDEHGENKQSVYHIPFYQDKNKIIMPK